MTIGEAITYYLNCLVAEGSPPNTIRAYRPWLLRLERVAADVGVVSIDKLTPPIVRQAVARIMNGATAGHSLNFKGGEASAAHLVWAVRGMSKCLRRDGIDMPDMQLVHAPRVPERIQPRITPEEFCALERAATLPPPQHQADAPSLFASLRDLTILYVLADTGLRAAEMSALDVTDINLAEGTLLVRRGKFKKDRELSLIDPGAPDGGLTLHTLRSYLAWRTTLPRARDQVALWISANRGCRLAREDLRRMLNRLCSQAGITGNRPPHAFRRATFTQAYHADPSRLPILAARMGWSAGADSNMAAVYTRGAAVDLARTQSQPSIAQRWRRGGAA